MLVAEARGVGRGVRLLRRRLRGKYFLGLLVNHAIWSCPVIYIYISLWIWRGFVRRL